MSDAIPLLRVPRLDYYQKLADDFQWGRQPDEPGAVHDWAETLAREQGVEIAPLMRKRLVPSSLAEAQGFLASAHGFANWPDFAAHVEALASPDSRVSLFEEAVDAIVAGDTQRLGTLLGEHPELVRARSMREHRSALLHYVSANGVENFRQKTPRNIIGIANLLLQAGAEVNAESDAYGGGSTTLGLTATSCHPENAGVQLRLLELLLAHGAAVDGPDGASVVNACLHNGRGAAAEFLARHGARLDLEGASGVGRLDVVKSFFDEDGSLRAPATELHLIDGFAWACEFGRIAIVSFLLETGLKPERKPRHNGQTGLHWAAYGGHPDIVKLLLQRGARVEAKDDSYNGTPLDWAWHGWRNLHVEPPANYREVVTLLMEAGAKPDPRILQAMRG